MKSSKAFKNKANKTGDKFFLCRIPCRQEKKLNCPIVPIKLFNLRFDYAVTAFQNNSGLLWDSNVLVEGGHLSFCKLV